MVTALQFFMGSDEVKEDSDSENEVMYYLFLASLLQFFYFCNLIIQQNENVIIKEVGMAARVNKKSRKREKQMERVKKTLKVWICSVLRKSQNH